MSWKRLGLVYCPDGTMPWARTHAALPAPVRVAADVFRIFFSARDAEQRSSVGWIDVDLSDAPRVVRHASEPVLRPGEDGSFDDSGVGIGCVTDIGAGRRLYYMGWNLAVRSPWRNAIGMAEATPQRDIFERYSRGPILDRSPHDPYSLSYPWVIRRGVCDWWMWYGSTLVPMATAADMQYVIKVATSDDGICWRRDGSIAIGLATSDEYAIARPTVVEAGDVLLMCFACRGERYRIGAAWSRDGLHWTRADTIFGLSPSAAGWDSEMTCYPALFWHRNRLWLAYNGNSYGATGVGLAVWNGDAIEDAIENALYDTSSA